MERFKAFIPLVLLAIGFFVLSVPLWLNIDVLPLRLWDESRNAVSAIEMYETHNWIVRTVDYVPDNWELKPPLITWFQVVSMHIFGLNELGVRFPSLLFSLGTLVVLFLLVFKMTKSKWAAFLASTITATSAGFYGEHVARFGDHDALLILLVVSLLYSVYSYATSGESKYIYLAAAFTMLGILAKSIAIGMTIPGMALWLLYDKKLLNILKNKHFYFAFFFALIPIAAYYYTREKMQPGYLSLVWELELFPRYLNSSNTINFNEHNSWYYVRLLAFEKMRFWVWSAVPLMLLCVSVTRKLDRRLLFWIITAVTFLLIISAGTKNFWYQAPVIPMISGAIAFSVFSISSAYKWLAIIISLPLLALSIISYKAAHKYALYPKEKPHQWETNGISHYLNDEEHLARLSSNVKVFLDLERGYEPHKFYLKALKLDRGLDIQRAREYTLKSGDTLLISHLSSLIYLKERFNVELLDSSFSHTKLLTITAKDSL